MNGLARGVVKFYTKQDPKWQTYSQNVCAFSPSEDLGNVYIFFHGKQVHVTVYTGNMSGHETM